MNDNMPPGLSQQGVWQVQSQTHPPVARVCTRLPHPQHLLRYFLRRPTRTPATTHRSTLHLATPLSRHAPATHTHRVAP